MKPLLLAVLAALALVGELDHYALNGPLAVDIAAPDNLPAGTHYLAFHAAADEPTWTITAAIEESSGCTASLTPGPATGHLAGHLEVAAYRGSCAILVAFEAHDGPTLVARTTAGVNFAIGDANEAVGAWLQLGIGIGLILLSVWWLNPGVTFAGLAFVVQVIFPGLQLPLGVVLGILVISIVLQAYRDIAIGWWTSWKEATKR